MRPLHTALLAPLLAAVLLASACGPAPVIAHRSARALANTLPVCPPPGFAAVPDLNLTAYTAAPWYAQLQVPISFQGEDPLEYLYCVRAEYVPLPANDPRVAALAQASTPDDGDDNNDDDDASADSSAGGVVVGSQQGPTRRRRAVRIFEVLNYANRGKVNGPPVGTSPNFTSADGRPLVAPLLPAELVAVPDPAAAGTRTANSRLLVGPSAYLTNLLAFNWRLGWGQYWVVAVMPSNDTRLVYDWAIVSGGPPEYPTPNGCLTIPPPQPPVGLSAASNFLAWLGFTLGAKAQAVDSVTRGSSRGLWLMSRRPVDPEGAREMLQTARQLGFDTSTLVAVQQQGCNYGAPPTAPASAPPPPPPAALPATANTTARAAPAPPATAMQLPASPATPPGPPAQQLQVQRQPRPAVTAATGPAAVPVPP